MAIWNSVAQAIAAATGRPFHVATLSPLNGGRVSSAYVLSDGATRYFVKTHVAGFARAYEWEARSLREIAAAGVPTPAVIATGARGTRSFLVLEYVEPARPPSPRAIAEALLRLHGSTAPTFGADATGYVSLDRLHRPDDSTSALSGCEPLDNTPGTSWVDFWCERRIADRMSGCAASPAWDAARPRIEALLPSIRAGLAAHRPAPALLHGDMNNHNWLSRPDGSLLFIDPACWYGDPEVDLAALAGGAPAGREALAIYVQESPRPAGFEWRLAVYTLWYLLSCWPVAAEPILTQTLDRIAGGPID